MHLRDNSSPLAIALDLLAMIGLGVVDTAVVVGVVVSNQEHT